MLYIHVDACQMARFILLLPQGPCTHKVLWVTMYNASTGAVIIAILVRNNHYQHVHAWVLLATGAVKRSKRCMLHKA